MDCIFLRNFPSFVIMFVTWKQSNENIMNKNEEKLLLRDFDFIQFQEEDEEKLVESFGLFIKSRGERDRGVW